MHLILCTFLQQYLIAQSDITKRVLPYNLIFRMTVCNYLVHGLKLEVLLFSTFDFKMNCRQWILFTSYVLRVHWRSSKILTLDDATIEQKCRVQYATTPSIVFFLKVSGALIFQNKKEADILGQPHYLA